VFFRGEAVVFVADFGFLAERARIDDLALTLYYADTGFGLTGRDRIAALRPLVRGYTIGLGSPLHACRASGAAVGYRPAAAVRHRRLGGRAR